MDEKLADDNILKSEKRRKLHKMREDGINPFPYSFERSGLLAELKAPFESLNSGEKVLDKKFKVAGRLVAKRDMGKACFFNLQDQSGRLQCYVKPQDLQDPMAQKAFDLIDIGDFVGVSGFFFKTQKGEVSIHCEDFQVLCKTLEVLPEKYHGIADPEMKYRYRHLDLIMNPDSMKVFVTRSKILKEIRNFLDSRGFLEVETPILQPIYGGAAAQPFKTHHRALDMTLFMKISPELYLKRLIVGGFDKVYDMNKNFRNEGIDRTHNPEFTMIEWYEAYTDYNYQMNQFEELVSQLALKVTGSMKISYQGKEIDFTPPWRRLTVFDGIREYAGVDPEKISDSELLSKIKELDPSFEKKLSRGAMLMHLFEETAEKHLWQPTFIMDHPEEISPLTKIHRTKKGLVERFEPFAACMELGNSYSELNDPEDQRNRLKEQESQRVSNDEAHPMDENFLHAIEVGMPPTGGVGLGVERIVMLLTDSSTIRDIILFPTLRNR